MSAYMFCPSIPPFACLRSLRWINFVRLSMSSSFPGSFGYQNSSCWCSPFPKLPATIRTTSLSIDYFVESSSGLFFEDSWRLDVALEEVVTPATFSEFDSLSRWLFLSFGDYYVCWDGFLLTLADDLPTLLLCFYVPVESLFASLWFVLFLEDYSLGALPSMDYFFKLLVFAVNGGPPALF